MNWRNPDHCYGCGIYIGGKPDYHYCLNCEKDRREQESEGVVPKETVAEIIATGRQMERAKIESEGVAVVVRSIRVSEYVEGGLYEIAEVVTVDPKDKIDPEGTYRLIT